MNQALQQIVERIRAATTDATPLCILGGGTKDFHGEAPQGETLRTTGLTGITSYEPSELVVTVRAGTPLAELEAVLAEKGQCLPFEPPHFGSSGATTVGGMVAAGLSGPARASVGAVRDYVLGATLVNGRGEVLSFGGQVMKNVAGYDVSRVLAGSLGTLGVITEVSLKVLPVAPAEATLEFACGQADALRLLNEWGGRPLPLNASCWFEHAGVGALYLRLRGAVAAVEAACAHLGGERKDNARAAADWQSLRDQQLPWFTAAEGPDALWRLSVPQTAPVLALALDGTAAAPLIEWHGGQRWYKAPLGHAAHIREIARAAGGHATLFRLPAGAGADAHHGIPRFDALSAPVARIHRALMQEFDPHRLFNRGRLFAAE
ncbi:glycolate oxidase subunit GlcE [Variovorax sp. KBW07]|uniref:glycolate oxidase subunit GlcE n=1 Tax=Variovorax sp. KBW07 TaxID=2153358 RepID=UPI000F5675BE|nr:glycolate oxidase subunit GlcE [Variovorax sp. KBW07]RQO35291.1 glycolate oxidase subunit GlcE [Variovorax sp. KBW07]